MQTANTTATIGTKPNDWHQTQQNGDRSQMRSPAFQDRPPYGPSKIGPPMGPHTGENLAIFWLTWVGKIAISGDPRRPWGPLGRCWEYV